MPTTTNLPLSSFDPRYKQLLLRGAGERFEVPCSSLKEARALRARIHTFRSRAKKHFGDRQREEWEPLFQCIIFLREAPLRLIFTPRSSEFDAALFSIPLSGKSAPPLAAPEPRSERDSLLDELEAEQQEPEPSLLRGDD